jgi:threonyl-tRNA synthetase
MLVVGDREQAESTVSVRHRAEGDLGAQQIEEFIEAASMAIRQKASTGPTFAPGVAERATS